MALPKAKRMKPRSDAVNMSEGADFSVINTSNRVKIDELVSSLKDRKAHADLKKATRSSQNDNKVLAAPLPKAEQHKIQRSLTYENVTQEVSKWNNIVEHNRLAERIDFPLQHGDLKLKTAMETTQKYTPKTALELEISSLLEKSKNVLRDDKMLTKAEEEALKAMDLEEAMARRGQIQKMRALQSYMEAKAHRQKKIKSKQYHRLMKKDRMKKEVKEFELMMKSDPNSALEKLEKIDKERILERMTLKHRGTSQWAKQLQSRAKYDKNARISLAEQLRINRELVKKVKNDDSEKEDEDDDEKNDVIVNKKVDVEDESPWLTQEKDANNENEEELEDAIEGYKKVWNDVREEIEKLKDEKKVKSKKEKKNGGNQFEKDAEKLENEMIKKNLKGESKGKKKKKKRKMADGVEKKVKFDEESLNLDGKNEKIADGNIETDFDQMETEVKPQVLTSNSAEMILKSDEDDTDDENDHRMTLAEAFADDDVTSAFKEEKDAAVKKDQPDDIDLFLPGWGSWGGAGLKVDPKLKERFTVKVPKLKRKDETIGNIILNEDKEKKLAKLQISEVPFPFTNAYYYEKSMQVPVGKNWQTESGFRKLISPKMVTKLGSIIEPIDEDAIVKEPVKDSFKIPTDKKVQNCKRKRK